MPCLLDDMCRDNYKNIKKNVDIKIAVQFNCCLEMFLYERVFI